MPRYRDLLWSVMLLGCLLSSRLAAAKPSTPPSSAPFAVEFLPRAGDDPVAPQLLRVSKLPQSHGFVRGSLLLLHSLQGRRCQPIGYAMVVRTQAREVEAVVQVLPKDAQAFPLSAGPMPEKVPLGKSLGVVLSQHPQPVPVAKEDEDRERVLLNLGAGDGVQVGDYFHALGEAVSDADASGRSLGRRTVGLLKILAIDALTATAGIEHGTAPAGAFVRFIGQNPPSSGAGKKREVTLLILRFSGEHGERFSDRLVDALQTQVLRGYKQIHIRHETTPIKDLDGTQTQIRQLGRRHGADMVVWGSVLCSDKRACIRPRVTMVSPDSQKWLGLLREEPERDIAHEELGRSALDQEKRVLGLASRVAGLALYQDDNYADAAWHLDRALRDGDDEAESVLPLLAQCYERIGHWSAAEQVAQEIRDTGLHKRDASVQALGHYWLARVLLQRGAPGRAQEEAQKAEQLYRALGEPGRRMLALTRGKIADIYQGRGQFDEALRIRREEELPVYEKLSDIREQAVTAGQIADVYLARGQFDEALRIYQENVLVREKLGDVRGRAVTVGRIADIHQARGRFDEALRIRRDEELPVYERLGDIRTRAVTMGKIADVHQIRGELNEALRIRRQEELPVYEKLGDIRSRTVALGKIADIYQAQGQLDEALHIRREEELPVYEKLGDIRSRAVTIGQVADIYHTRGQLDEALRIRLEEELPIYEKLGDFRLAAVTMGQIANIYQARGQFDEALRIRREDELPVYKKLQAGRDVLLCEANIAITLLNRNGTGDQFEAKRLLRKVLVAAEKTQLPEADTIRELLSQMPVAPKATRRSAGPSMSPRSPTSAQAP